MPDDAVVVEPTELPGPGRRGRRRCAAPCATRSSGPPLADWSGPERGQVAVVFPDLTRPMPNRTVLPPLLAELERLGAGPDRVELLCATGTHRQATAAEMAELVGADIVGRYRIHDHGRTTATTSRWAGGRAPVRLDRRYVEADVAHPAPDSSSPTSSPVSAAGPRGCARPGRTETILEAHCPARIADPRATWLVTEGNPVHDFVRAAAALAPPTLSLDVAINSRRQLTAVFAGPLPDGHAAACAFVERTVVQPVGGRSTWWSPPTGAIRSTATCTRR